jgi:hypothetical protein
LFVNVSSRTTVCPPTTVLAPLDGAVGLVVGLPDDVGEPVSVGEVGDPVSVDDALTWNCGGTEKGSRPEKIGLGLGPPVGSPDGPTEGPTVGPPVGAIDVEGPIEIGGSAAVPPLPS